MELSASILEYPGYAEKVSAKLLGVSRILSENNTTALVLYMYRRYQILTRPLQQAGKANCRKSSDGCRLTSMLTQ